MCVIFKITKMKKVNHLCDESIWHWFVSVKKFTISSVVACFLGRKWAKQHIRHLTIWGGRGQTRTNWNDALETTKQDFSNGVTNKETSTSYDMGGKLYSSNLHVPISQNSFVKIICKASWKYISISIVLSPTCYLNLSRWLSITLLDEIMIEKEDNRRKVKNEIVLIMRESPSS